MQRQLVEKKYWKSFLREHGFFLLLLLAAAALTLFRLGVYPFWADEVSTAFYAKSILRTGFPIGWDGHTLLAFENGRELNQQFLAILLPWLHYYVTAGFFWLFGESSWSGRLPSVLFGLASIMLMYRTLLRCGFERRFVLLSVGLLVFSLPFLLHLRQCRYYGQTIFLTIAFVSVATSQQLREHWRSLCLGLLGALLLHTQYLIGVCFLLSYMVVVQVVKLSWRRFCWDGAGVALSVVLFLPWFLWCQTGEATQASNFSINLLQSLKQLSFYPQAYNTERFFPLLLWPWSALLLLRKASKKEKSALDMVCIVGIVLYSLFIVILSPEVKQPPFAQPRYLIVLLPYFAVLAARCFCLLILKNRTWPMWFMAFIFTFTHFFYFPKFLVKPTTPSGLIGVERSAATAAFPVYGYMYELLHPLPSVQFAARDLLQQHTKNDDVIFVRPEHNGLPLFHLLPERRYCCQLDENTHLDYGALQKVLPLYHFSELNWQPEWMLMVGYFWHNNPYQFLQEFVYHGASYQLVDRRNVWFRAPGRPTLVEHFFYEVRNISPQEGVALYRKVTIP